jgi:hypothetical protein
VTEEPGAVDAGTVPEPTSVDSGVVMPELTTITLRNLSALETPPEGILVIVSSREGVKIDIGLTDAEGNAHLQVPAGSTVTTIAESHFAVNGEPHGETAILSWFEVPAVDPLYMDIWQITGERVAPEPPPVSIKASLVANRTGTEGDYGTFEMPCNYRRSVRDAPETTGFSATYEFIEARPCQGMNEIEVWGFAREGWAYGTVPVLPTPGDSISLVADNRQWDTSTLFADGIPAGAERVAYNVWASMKAESPGLYRDNYVSLPVTQEILPVDVPHAAFHHVSANANVRVQSDPNVYASAFRTGSAVADLHWNVSQDLAHPVSASLQPREIASRPSVKWQLSDTGKLGDYAEVDMEWRDVYWVAYIPSARFRIVQFPDLPWGPDRYAPWPEDEIYFSGVTIMDDLFIDGYQGYLSEPHGEPVNFNQTYLSP